MPLHKYFNFQVLKSDMEGIYMRSFHYFTAFLTSPKSLPISSLACVELGGHMCDERDRKSTESKEREKI